VGMKYLPACEDGTDRLFRNVGVWNSDAGELPRRKHTTFRTGRKFEINYKFSLFSEAGNIKAVMFVERNLFSLSNKRITFNRMQTFIPLDVSAP